MENMDLPIRSHNSSILNSLAVRWEITWLSPKRPLINFEEINREQTGWNSGDGDNGLRG